jgi:hypothetical protein
MIISFTLKPSRLTPRSRHGNRRFFADDEPTRLRVTQATTLCRQMRGREAVEIAASRA